jgi:hypothetical protein
MVVEDGEWSGARELFICARYASGGIHSIVEVT